MADELTDGMVWGRVQEASIPLSWRPPSCQTHTFTMYQAAMSGQLGFTFFQALGGKAEKWKADNA